MGDPDLDRLVDRLIARLPQQDSDPRAMKWLKGLMPTFIILFGFGGQITFTVIPTITKDEDIPSHWSAGEVRTFLCLAWFFFTIGLGVSSAVALTQVYASDLFIRRFQPGSNYEAFIEVLCALLQLALALAFLFLSLVVVAYTPAVGWVSFGVSSFCVVISIFSLIIDMFL
jgi:MFS family permease